MWKDWSSGRKTVALALLLAAVTFAVFSRAAMNDFVDYDDPVYVLENAHVLEGYFCVVAGLRAGCPDW